MRRSPLTGAAMAAMVAVTPILGLGCSRAPEAPPAAPASAASSTTNLSSGTLELPGDVPRPGVPLDDPAAQRATSRAVVPEVAGRPLPMTPPIPRTAEPPSAAPTATPGLPRARVPMQVPGHARPVLVPQQTAPDVSPRAPTTRE